MKQEVGVLHARIVSGAGGGPEKTILNSPRHLAHTRYRALAAYIHSPGDSGFIELERRATQQDCPLFGFPETLPIDPRTLKRLAALCREQNVRIWHGHDYKSNLYGLLLKRRLGLRLVTTVHGWVHHTRKTPLYFAVDRYAIRRYEQVVCVSQDLFERCHEFGVSAEKLSRIENAIDTEEFRRTRPARESELRAEAGVPPERLLIGAAGRLSEEKGFLFLIEAVERLLDEGIDLELWIAGTGDQQAQLQARIDTSRHSGRLRLLGWRPDTLALFEAFDLFCLSSLREGLPNVVLEAMAMEVPLLATRCGGMQAFARDGEDALLCELASSEALAEGLARLARDGELRAKLARTARARIETDFSFARRMRHMTRIYDRLGI